MVTHRICSDTKILVLLLFTFGRIVGTLLRHSIDIRQGRQYLKSLFQHKYWVSGMILKRACSDTNIYIKLSNSTCSFASLTFSLSLGNATTPCLMISRTRSTESSAPACSNLELKKVITWNVKHHFFKQVDVRDIFSVDAFLT